MTIAWSYGGGVQTAAIAVLIREGGLPKPDLAVIADTSREVQSTWDYLYNVVQPYLKPAGVKVEVAPHSLARVDLYDKNGCTIMPAWTEEGRLSSFCSGEWKRDVCMRWLRLQGVESCDQWIGYSIDEMHRVPKQDRRKWCRLDFPLINKFINRAMCLRIIEAAGLPIPKKSRCWMCPHQTAEEWQEIRASPDAWAAAVHLDKQIRERDPEQKGLFLHSSRLALELAPADDSKLTPGRHCEATGCWT